MTKYLIGTVTGLFIGLTGYSIGLERFLPSMILGGMTLVCFFVSLVDFWFDSNKQKVR